MRTFRVIALDQPGAPERAISERLRSQLVYFATASGTRGAPELGPGEYFLLAEDVARFLEDGFLELVSPLDTANMTEVELSDEQLEFLEWLRASGVQHIRIE